MARGTASDPTAATTATDPGRRLSRRHLISGGAGVVGGAALGVAGAGWAAGGPAPAPETPPIPADAVGSATEPFHGAHQIGVSTTPQAHGTAVAFDLRPGVDRDALRRWMTLWTDDAERLTAGRPSLADTEPELALAPARLTVTVAFGPGVLTAADAEDLRPDWLAPLPAFGVDRLQDRWSGGDLLVQIASDDPVTLAHARRVLVKDARAFATTRWEQAGFLHVPGAHLPGATPRNLMGQVDGTTNPQAGADDFDAAVWIADGPDWLRGGTSLVLRRIRMELDTWDELDRPAREQAVGRRLDTGAPLTGEHEHDEPDFGATDAIGFTVIPDFAHVRRAHVADPRMRMLRRSYNYDVVLESGAHESGLVFAAYQADLATQFLPVQQSLDEMDLLNQWTTPIGSAVFAVLPGVEDGEYFGSALLA